MLCKAAGEVGHTLLREGAILFGELLIELRNLALVAFLGSWSEAALLHQASDARSNHLQPSLFEGIPAPKRKGQPLSQLYTWFAVSAGSTVCGSDSRRVAALADWSVV